jgi:hypothetical protein
MQLRHGVWDASEGSDMDSLREIGFLFAILAAWFVLNRWVLPKFGVST